MFPVERTANIKEIGLKRKKITCGLRDNFTQRVYVLTFCLAQIPLFFSGAQQKVERKNYLSDLCGSSEAGGEFMSKQ